MTHLLLIRHGETDWNVEGRWQGQTDVPLNRKGIEQAEQVAGQLKDQTIDIIYTSDLQRAFETARRLADGRDIPVKADPRLREINRGDWEGLLASEIESRYETEFRTRRVDPLNIAPPGGETARQVQDRALEVVYEIIDRHPCETVGIVSHGFTLALVRVQFSGLPIQAAWDLVPQNGEIIALSVDGD